MAKEALLPVFIFAFQRFDTLAKPSLVITSVTDLGDLMLF
jgi:hypothetical protein